MYQEVAVVSLPECECATASPKPAAALNHDGDYSGAGVDVGGGCAGSPSLKSGVWRCATVPVVPRQCGKRQSFQKSSCVPQGSSGDEDDAAAIPSPKDCGTNGEGDETPEAAASPQAAHPTSAAVSRPSSFSVPKAKSASETVVKGEADLPMVDPCQNPLAPRFSPPRGSSALPFSRGRALVLLEVHPSTCYLVAILCLSIDTCHSLGEGRIVWRRPPRRSVSGRVVLLPAWPPSFRSPPRPVRLLYVGPPCTVGVVFPETNDPVLAQCHALWWTFRNLGVAPRGNEGGELAPELQRPSPASVFSPSSLPPEGPVVEPPCPPPVTRAVITAPPELAYAARPFWEGSISVHIHGC